MIAQSCALASRQHAAPLGLPSFRECTPPLLVWLRRDGVFCLGLTASAFVTASLVLAVLNREENPAASATFQERYQTSSFRQLHPNQVWPERVEQAEQYGTEQPAPSNFPRVVRTFRFVDPQASLANAPASATAPDGAAPLSLQANGTSLEDMRRSDGSLRLRIALRGSLQNPAWSPDGQSIAFTRFRNGYNKGPSDVYVINLKTNELKPVAADGSNNISQPGSSWNRQGQIVFSSDRSGHDEVWMVGSDQTRAQKITSRSSHVAYEPSFGPDGKSLVFESHADGRGKSRVTLFDASQGRYTDLTPPDEDCRQPNWSPRGDYIVYQKLAKGRWDLWVFDVKVKQHRPVTTSGNNTDATFSPDGRFIVYSGERSGQDGASLLAMPVEGGRSVPITRHRGYHGAPSWSPDGAYVAMEASARDPDGSQTELIITPVQKTLARLSVEGG